MGQLNAMQGLAGRYKSTTIEKIKIFLKIKKKINVMQVLDLKPKDAIRGCLWR